MRDIIGVPNTLIVCAIIDPDVSIIIDLKKFELIILLNMTIFDSYRSILEIINI